MKRVAVIGITGSIGKQALEIISGRGNEYALTCISAHSEFTELVRIANRYKVPVVAYSGNNGDKNAFNYPCTFFQGDDALVLAAETADYDIFLNSVVGIAALRPTLIAMEKGARIALANKEMLVCAGEYVMRKARELSSEIIPVDSEHSAIFQCLASGRKEDVDTLIITSSGGAFRDVPLAEIDALDPTRALSHPNWNMGKKITIDCATMVNKAFEVIEAEHLFEVPSNRIETVIHRESIVHSMVRFKDGSVIAQLAEPDMRLPIQYALSYPRKTLSPVKRLPLTFELSFREVDPLRYPCFILGLEAAKKGGLFPCAYMSADDEIVPAYLSKKLKYSQISDVFEKVLSHFSLHDEYDLSDVFYINKEVKEYTRRVIGEL